MFCVHFRDQIPVDVDMTPNKSLQLTLDPPPMVLLHHGRRLKRR